MLEDLVSMPGGRDDDALYEGIVASPPNADGHIEVVIPAFDPELRHGPCPFMPRGTGTPARGDRCVVAFAEGREPWVVAWDGPIGTVDLAPLTGRVGALETADVALDGRLDTLEATDVALDGRLDVLEAAQPVKRGVLTVSWPGAATLSSVSAAVAHGLGGTPTGVLLTPQGQAGTGPVYAWLNSKSSTTFTVQASTGPNGFQPGAGLTQTFAWQAWL